MKNNIEKLQDEIIYFRAKDLASYLSINKSSVWKMAKDGLITPIKLTEKVTIFSKIEIDQLIKDRNN
ncbi:helix-turn-helix domain-containing protein [Sulfurimonas sp.]|uniref:helix-turn-helix transcriptional regulator n=1 Tax=Sulfurimonas sp. TaxID=2022749 RepID=UPI002AB1A62A|nr:helix-turn-helix domain-containing protein [Sulfurimonas sp.]